MLNLCTHPCFSMFYGNFPICLIKLSTTRSYTLKSITPVKALIRGFLTMQVTVADKLVLVNPF